MGIDLKGIDLQTPNFYNEEVCKYCLNIIHKNAVDFKPIRRRMNGTRLGEDDFTIPFMLRTLKGL